MLELFANTPSPYLLAATGAFLLGIAKSGVKGIAVFIVVSLSLLLMQKHRPVF